MTHQTNKTAETDASVTAFIDTVDDEQKRADAWRLVAIMSKITGAPARMWGDRIVGFGSYHYRYESGREGDMPITGFSPRKAAITLYLNLGDGWEEAADMLARLGTHKLGKGCLYFKRLADVDESVLTDLIRASAAKYAGQDMS